ncbi:FAD binding domain-containing protein [Verticillium alfalfae VaMs.102]|uniref:FAD binding domain-containing protein n=1 Tax=Verticillium alfalfae (strain VaMs.102 / ATCC MYA-4576 / FGSC 10136) TaxID=526221 RepID=C9SGT5_VERA1|nr:FAD binding domain-containing protein [Verticillium alfalfae VaMs.102]EEY18179.1 FAD binding domain-containing protein [Verticillium alfalfae VaMs.102]
MPSPRANMTVGVLLALGSAGMATRSCVSRCCLDLKNVPSLEGKVYFPDSEAYEARLQTYWSVSAALEPWCMVQPSTAEDVSVAIKTIVAGDCPFGIRGGGHGAHALSNGVEHGITIDFDERHDLGSRNQACISPARSHWQTVYDELAPYGVAVTGGRAGTVGTGGFISGGGNSFHSASHGMGCDTVANFEVVLADGSIVNANATSNPDLWQALKGSSGNLGLITRFDMYPIEFPDPERPVVWGGNLYYDLKSGPALIDALVQFTDNVHKDENSSSIVYWAHLPQILGGTILNAAVENTLGEVKPAAFEVYYDVEGLYDDTTKVDTLSAVTNALGAGQPAGFRNAWFTASFKNDARPMNYAREKFHELMQRSRDSTGVPYRTFNTLSPHPDTRLKLLPNLMRLLASILQRTALEAKLALQHGSDSSPIQMPLCKWPGSTWELKARS